MMTFARYSIALFLLHKLILCISVSTIRIQEESSMNSKENLIPLLTSLFMEEMIAGLIQRHRVLIRQEIIRVDIYWRPNHLELIRNMIRSGLLLDPLILLKENMLRNLADGYLK